MEYAVIEKGTADRLEEEVTRRLFKGWKCQGGVSVFWNAGGWKYAQAMVKEAPCPK